MAERFPNSRFWGWDFSEEGIAAANAEAASKGLKNATFEVKDAATVDGSQQFDFITVFDAIHDQAKPDVVWVGTGENNPRNSVTYGDGVYKSTDGGKTWTNMGLKKSFQVGKVIVHPKNPDTVYVGALGRATGRMTSRGLPGWGQARARSSAAATCSEVHGKSGSSASAWRTSSSSSVQPSTTPPAPASHSSSTSPTTVRREESRTRPWISSP